MAQYGILIGSVLSLMGLLVPSPSHDLKIVTRRSLGRITYNLTEYYSGSRSREESGTKMDNLNGHRLATIVDHGEPIEKKFVLDLDAHEYVVYETNTNKGASNSGIKTFAPQYSGGTLDIFIESVDTGERREMFGHTARHIITRERRVPGPGSCSTSSQSQTDGWYIDSTVLPEWRRPRLGVISFLVAASCFDKIEVHRTGVHPGFPMQATTTLTGQTPNPDPRVAPSTNSLEVVEFSEVPLDPALFVVPQDFRLVTELTSMNKPRTLTTWERFKNWLADQFR